MIRCGDCPMAQVERMAGRVALRCGDKGPWAGRVVATAPPGHVPDTEAPAWCPVRAWRQKAEEAQDGDSKQV